jgi:hypothetical protein
MGLLGDDSSKDEELEAAAAVVASIVSKRHWGGSVIGHKTYKRDRHVVEQQLNRDYFSEDPIYDEDQFRQRYCHLLSLLSQFVHYSWKVEFFEQNWKVELN